MTGPACRFLSYVLAGLARDFRKSTLRSLAVQRELLLAHRILEQAGIAHVALKGAYLAFHCYPHPALRPLRDIDILVAPERGPEAYRKLIDGGLVRTARVPGDPESVLDSGVHYPPLRFPGGHPVEFHGRLFHRDPDSPDVPDPADDPGYWARTMTRMTGDAEIRYASPTDLLFHLIVHAAYDHQLNNGPLALTYIAHLLRTSPVDWPLFWNLGRAARRLRGCVLLLRMADHYHGPLPIDYQGQSFALDEHSLVDWAVLFLQDSTTRHSARALDGAVGLGRRATVIMRELFPPRRKIASLYPVSPGSPRVFAYYPARWWWLLNTRLRESLAARARKDLVAESGAFVRYQGWLSLGDDENTARAREG